LAELLAGCDVSRYVRDEVGASWQRSAAAGLKPDRVEVPFDPAVDNGGPLVRAAGPALDQLVLDLDGAPVGTVLADATGHVVDVRCADGPLGAGLSRVRIAPGSVFAEHLVGTNAIGTALAGRAPVAVDAAEHFAENLTTLTGAAAPISDPRSGRTLGVIGLVSLAGDRSALMLPLATRAAREIENRLVDAAGISERLMLRRFLRERRRVKGPFVLISERRMITNAAADRFVAPGDEDVLWECVRQLLGETHPDTTRLVLRGLAVDVRCEPVLDGSVIVGALVRLRPLSEAPPDASRYRQVRRPYGWESLTETEASVTELVAQGLTNKEVAARLFMSRHTVDFHMRSIFRKLDVNSRVDVARIALEHRVTAR
jgi:DNA-binding CsgD family transcriptional regulator